MADSDPAESGAQRRTSRATVVEHEELYRLLTEHASDYIRLHDLEGNSIYASQSVERLYGCAPDSLFERQHPDDAEICEQWWRQVLAGGKERLQWRVRDVSGTWRWIETAA